MTSSFNVASVKISLLICILIQLSMALYKEQIDSKHLDRFFHDEECIEGTLASIEAAWPTFKDFTISGGIFISSDKNESQNEFVTSEKNEMNDKSPLSLVSELAQFNKVKAHYDVIEEKGPAHNKRFLVSLKLGEEEFEAEGSSIKQAQREAARLALNSTSLEHPPQNLKQNKQQKVLKTSVEKLAEWVYKRIDVKIKYYYFEETKYKPNFDDYFHSKPETVYKAVVKINDKEFVGEGLSIFAAKENAASLALSNLKNLDGLCPFNNNEGGVLAKLFGYDSDSQCPISLINEFGLKSNIKTSLSLHEEEGPAHLKHFVFKCTVGDHETFGDGSSKKEAKREAAKKMVKILKTQAFYNAENCSKVFKKDKKKKKKKAKNLTKSYKPKPSYLEEDEDPEVLSSNNIPMNPISKLYEVQQRTHGVEPIFKLIEERGMANKEFTMQVLIGDVSSVGTGPNKKAAKKKAAEEMLKKLGYSSNSNKQHLPSVEQKKKEFTKNNNLKNIKIKSIASSELVDSELEFSKVEQEPTSVSSSSNNMGTPKKHVTDNIKNSVDSSDTPTQNPKTSKSKFMQPLQDLKSLTKQMGIRFEFYDFPKANKMGFVSLLSLTTNPPKVCKGSGETVAHSQEKAALSALENLYKSQLETISNVLGKTGDVEEKTEKTILELPVYFEKE